MTELKCPFKFSHYEFEGGQECIGSECGMHKLCNANDAPPKGMFQVSHDYGSTFSPPVKIQGEQDSRDSRIRKGLGYKDVPPHEPSEATKRFIEELDSELDSSEKLEADALALVDNLRVYGCNYAGDAEVEIIGMLDRKAAITDSECRSEFNVLDEHAQALERENAELKAKLDQMTVERDDAHEQWKCWSKLATDIIALFYPVEEEGLPNDAYNVVKDSASKLTAERDELQAKVDEYENKSEICTLLSDGKIYTGSKALTERIAELQAKVDGYVEALEKLGCSVLANGTVFWPSDCGASCSGLQKQVDELTAELTAARNAHAQAEHEAVILREKLGRALDYAHEITSVGGDC